MTCDLLTFRVGGVFLFLETDLKIKLLIFLALFIPVTAIAQLETQWVELYVGDYFDMIYDHIETADGGFAFTGYTRPDIYGMGGVWLGKTNRDGELLWERRHEFEPGEAFNGTDEGYTLFEQDDGGFLVVGFMGYSTNDNGWPWNDDILVFKTDAEGDSILWSRTFGGDGWEKAFKAIRTDDGGYALAGVTTSWGAGNEDLFLLKLDENCDSLWMRTYGDRGVDICNDLIQTSDGGYALIGSTTMIRNTPSSYWALFVDENGDSLRSCIACYRGDDSVGYTIQELDDGNFIVSGRVYNSYPEFSNCSRIWTLGLDADARGLWGRIDGSDNIYSSLTGYASCLLSDTSVAITGMYSLSREFGSPYGKLWILEVTATGEGRYILDEGWEEPTSGKSIILTTTNELCVAGYAGRATRGTGYDGQIYKTSEMPNSVESSFIGAFKNNMIISAYPNPFNEKVRITLTLAQVGGIDALSIYNYQGKLVKKSNCQELIASASFLWQPGELPSGCYFVDVRWKNQLFRKQIILVK